jgi:hypothetical protein
MNEPTMNTHAWCRFEPGFVWEVHVGMSRARTEVLNPQIGADLYHA